VSDAEPTAFAVLEESLVALAVEATPGEETVALVLEVLVVSLVGIEIVFPAIIKLGFSRWLALIMLSIET
jgi:hypothetical protein